MRASLLLFSLVALGASGCFAKTTLDVGSNDAGPPSAHQVGPDASVVGTPVPVDHGPPYDPEVLAGARAACAAPHGAVDPAPTVADVRSRLLGAWFMCSTSDPSEDRAQSRVYSPDGTFFNLVDDGHGGLVASMGIDNQGTYQIDDSSNSETPDAAPDAPSDGFVPRFQSGGMQPDFVAFEKGPKRMKIVVGTAGFEEWFVYLGPGSAAP